MAKRRCFERAFCFSDEFTERLSPEAKLAYFAICLETDDDGFCSNPVSAASFFCKSRQSARKSIEELAKFGYLLKFPETGVVLVSHFNIHNNRDNKNHTDTIHQDLLTRVSLTGKVYRHMDPSEGTRETDGNQTDSSLPPDGNQTDSSLPPDRIQTDSSLQKKRKEINRNKLNLTEKKRSDSDCAPSTEQVMGTETSEQIGPLFTLFTTAWPKKPIDNVISALQAFRELSPDHNMVTEMIDGIRRQQNSGAGEYFAHDPTAWIRERRWTWKQKGGQGGN